MNLNTKNLNCKKAIVSLSVSSILLLLISDIVLLNLDGNLRFVNIILYIPKILMIVYLLGFYKKSKATIIVPIVFAIEAISCFLGFITFYSLKHYRILAIVNLLFCILFISATLNTLKGFSKKVFVAVPLVLAIMRNIYSIIEILVSFANNFYNSHEEIFISNLLGYFAGITFNLALLLFCLKNTIPVILHSKNDTIKSEQINPEQLLRQLQDKYNMGLISEEEYKSQRAEILSKL